MMSKVHWNYSLCQRMSFERGTLFVHYRKIALERYSSSYFHVLYEVKFKLCKKHLCVWLQF